MHAPRPTPSSADVAMEVSSLSVGLGILMMALFPFALPALVLLQPHDSGAYWRIDWRKHL